MYIVSMVLIKHVHCNHVILYTNLGVMCLLLKLSKIQLYSHVTFFFIQTYERSSGITYFNEKINAHVAIINNSHCPGVVWW